jgi:hypothetical protein
VPLFSWWILLCVPDEVFLYCVSGLAIGIDRGTCLSVNMCCTWEIENAGIYSPRL